ncbi:MAG: sigma-54-dependent Fis family transcriptional regulator [Ignavibacteriales bacterium]|nr:sigma-54-dependent Fis family transcriptional regulator [Ignavibacteriales bacterium]
MEKLSILIIDDEESQLQSLKSFLTRRDYEVTTASNGEDGFDVLSSKFIDVVLTDYRMPNWDGFTVLKKVKEFNPEIDVVVMTAYGSVEDAVDIMKAGAYDYLSKPIDLDELENLLNRIREKRFLVSENKLLKEQLNEKFKFDSIISESSIMEEVLNTAGRVANSKTSVLIRGESGTGKELIARAIHHASPRKDKPFVTVNISSLAENLLESELFGHEKGAFTGATNQRIGRFEEADGGTLFIDEVGDIPLQAQVKLLRAIQFGEIQKLGGNSTIKVDVRIITATHRDLELMIKNGEFREDLFYRLNVISIHLPSLRQRKSDIPILVDHLIKKHSEINQKIISSISSEAMDQLMKYQYPGNIRELENIIERAVVLCRGDLITKSDLPAQIGKISEKKIFDPTDLEDGYEEKVRSFEKEIIFEALSRTNGNKSAAARILNITERHLRSRIEILDIKDDVNKKRET